MKAIELNGTYYFIDKIFSFRIYQQRKEYLDDPGYSFKMNSPDFNWRINIRSINGEYSTERFRDEAHAKEIEKILTDDTH